MDAHSSSDARSVRTVRRRSPGRTFRALTLLPLLLALAACDAGGIYDPGYGGSRYLRSGLYQYDTWSEDGRHAWWGTLDIDVYGDGEIRGTYRLPLQCEDAYGYLVDCVGRVGGRVYSDGEIRFGLDEGWLRNEGGVNRYSEAGGFWETRILGYYDTGDFELVPY